MGKLKILITNTITAKRVRNRINQRLRQAAQRLDRSNKRIGVRLEIRPMKNTGNILVYGSAEVLLDGKPLTGVTGIEFSFLPDTVAKAKIEFMIESFEVAGVVIDPDIMTWADLIKEAKEEDPEEDILEVSTNDNQFRKYISVEEETNEIN